MSRVDPRTGQATASLKKKRIPVIQTRIEITSPPQIIVTTQASILPNEVHLALNDIKDLLKQMMNAPFKPDTFLLPESFFTQDPIVIDESVIDVQEKTTPLVKNEMDKPIGSTNIESDSNLKSSKDKLKSLKKK